MARSNNARPDPPLSRQSYQLPIWGHSEVPNKMLLPEVNNRQVLEKRVTYNLESILRFHFDE